MTKNDKELWVVILLILMILLSACIDIPVNGGDKGYFSLWRSEFAMFVYDNSRVKISVFQIITWMVLILAHAGVVCLPFLIRKSYFGSLLLAVPLIFILAFMLFASGYIVILLVPFIIVWIICMIVQSRQIATSPGLRIRTKL